ncbi:MAG: hypothetical protein K0R31_2392 [Clostridiales bacterium]|nr:hypothetical protein [Clostridiales bacterium]
MTSFYTAHPTRSQAFLLERRLKAQGINCELSYMPREIMIDLCNMGVKFEESEYGKAIDLIRRAGLPGCKIYREIKGPRSSQYIEER